MSTHMRSIGGLLAGMHAIRGGRQVNIPRMVEIYRTDRVVEVPLKLINSFSEAFREGFCLLPLAAMELFLSLSEMSGQVADLRNTGTELLLTGTRALKNTDIWGEQVFCPFLVHVNMKELPRITEKEWIARSQAGWRASEQGHSSSQRREIYRSVSGFGEILRRSCGYESQPGLYASFLSPPQDSDPFRVVQPDEQATGLSVLFGR